MHPDEQSTGTMITNTGVLDVTKDLLGDLVVSKTTGDTTLQLDHYTLPTATDSQLGGIKVGSNLSIDQNGVLSATGGAGYTAGDGINIRTETIGSEYDTSSEYYSIDETDLGYIGGSFTLTSERAALPKYAFVASHYNNNWNGPVLFSKNPEAVKYDTRGYTSNPVAFTYNNETWYKSDNGYWYQNSSISTNIKVDDLTGVVYDESDLVDYICSLLDTMHTESHAETIIENTGVLDVTKDNNGDLVVSKTTGDTTLQLDHYTLPTATDSQLGGIKVGSNLSIDQNGVLSATGGAGYTAGDGINIRTETIGSEYDTSSEYYSIDETDLGYIGGSFTLTSERAALPKYAFVASHYNNNWNGPVLFSKNPEAVKYDTRGYTSNPVAFTYNNETWYKSDNGYWYQNSSISTNIKVDDLTGVVYDESDLVDYICSLLDTMHTESHAETIIENTGVLDVTKDNNGDLVVSKTTGDTTLQLDHYTLPTASSNTLGGIKVGDELHIDSNGVLSGNTYVEGDGIRIAPPDSYEVLSYVRSNKAGWIHTGLFCTTGTLTIDLEFNYPVDVQTLGEWQLIVTTYERRTGVNKPGDIGYGVVNFTSPGSRLSVGKYYDAGGGEVRTWWYYTNSYTTGDFQDHCVWNYSTYSSSNIGIGTMDGAIPTNDEICIFQGRTDVILYWMKIYDDTTMIADLVPVRNMTTNEIGLYNRVTDTFLPITVPSSSGNSLIGGTATGEIIGDVEGLYAITNTGVLDVTKNNNGDLVVSTINGDTTLSLDHYTLPTASANTLGGIKVGENLSIDQDGVLSAAGGGESKEYLAGEGISITERSEERDTPIDISSENWVNETPDGGRGSRYTIY